MSINNNNSQKEELVFLVLSEALADQPHGVDWPVFNSEDWKRFGNAALAEGVAPRIFFKDLVCIMAPGIVGQARS